MATERKAKSVFCIAIAAMLLSGCGKETKAVEGIEHYVAGIEDIEVPAEAKIIGLGEATHGNIELQNLKKEVFQVLVENGDCRVFALEADFGGGCKVNDYIHGGEGTAEKAVAELGFGLYRTDAMADFVEWLRKYNETVTVDRQVCFYGFDMQRYDNNKEILFAYLSKVDDAGRLALEESLQGLTDETVYAQTEEENKKAAEDMQIFLANMEEKRDSYIAMSDEKSYETAYACAECIMQNATIQSGSVSYNAARDQYMADKVATIMELEPNERIMISGHNGHIEKKSSNASYTCMGELLAKEYGTEYYTIGTDFIEGEVNVINGRGDEQNIHFKSENALKEQVRDLEGNIFYINIATALENPALSDILNNPLKMISIGNEFSSGQKLLETFYTVSDIPAESYDGIIILKTVTPTDRKPVPED